MQLQNTTCNTFNILIIRLKLTGKYTVNYSNATFLDAYDIRKNKFDEKLLHEIGIDSSIMPDVFACEDIVGEVTPKATQEAGLWEGIAVAAGQADFNAGCIGGGIIREGEINMNLGTCAQRRWCKKHNLEKNYHRCI